MERRQALIEARTGRRMANAVTTTDVTTLVSSGLSDDVIINHIRANGVAAPLTSSEVLQLNKQGVSENVINAMEAQAAKQAAATPVVSRSSRDRGGIVRRASLLGATSLLLPPSSAATVLSPPSGRFLGLLICSLTADRYKEEWPVDFFVAMNRSELAGYPPPFAVRDACDAVSSTVQ